MARNGGVNALRLSTKIRVEGAQNDTCVGGGSVMMKAQKVTAIVSQKNPALGGRERQKVGVRHGGVRDPASSEVITSWPSRRSSSTTGNGVFSLE